MLKLDVIGALGADPVTRISNGREFISFNVAHNYRKVTEEGEITKDETVWVSCALNGSGGALLPWLRKGTQVYVSGKPTFKTYKNNGQYFVDVQLSVDTLKLLPAPLTSSQRQSLDVMNKFMGWAETKGFTSFDDIIEDYENNHPTPEQSNG